MNVIEIAVLLVRPVITSITGAASRSLTCP